MYDERTGHIELVSADKVHDEALSERESEEIKELEHKVDVITTKTSTMQGSCLWLRDKSST